MATQYTTPLPTEAHLLETIGQRLAQRRIELDLTQAELAKIAGVGKRTLERLEAGGSTQMTNFLRIVRQLELLPDLMAVFPEPGLSPMELLKAKGKERKRVRHKKKPAGSMVREEASGWTWAE